MEEAGSVSETVVIAELDLNVIATVRDIGSVKPLKDRCIDLYSLVCHMSIEITLAF